DWLKRWAAHAPRSVALRCADSNRSFTYRELFERSSALAARLQREHGIARGDRVAVLAMNEPETIFLFFALQRLGAMLVPVNFRFASREVEHVLRDSDSKLFFYQEAYSGIVSQLKAKPAQTFSYDLLSRLLFSGEGEIFGDSVGAFTDPVMIL